MHLKVINRLNVNKEKYMLAIGNVAVINVCLAVVAFSKDLFLASYMGTSVEADALFLAFFITDTVGNNLFGNAVGTSCIPAFSKLYASGDEQRFYKYMVNFFVYVTLIAVFLLVGLFLTRNLMVDWLGKGFPQDVRDLSVIFLNILLPSIILYPAVALGISILQIRRSFVVSSLAPVLFNLIFLIGILCCYTFKIQLRYGAILSVSSIMVGIIGTLILIGVWVVKSNGKITGFLFSIKTYKLSTEDFRWILGVFKVFIIYLVIVFLSQAMMYIERYLASGFNSGSIAALNYAYRLAQFPVWVFVAAIGTVVFPLMSKYQKECNFEELRKVLKRSEYLILVITIPMAVVLYVFRKTIVTVLFFRGAFDINSLKVTTDILKGYAPAIIGQSLTAICLKFFLSAERVWLLFVTLLISSTVNITLDFYLVPRVGLAGLGYGASWGSLVNSIVLLYMMNRSITKCVKKVLL